MKKWQRDAIIAVIILVTLIIIGTFYLINGPSLGYTDSALVFIAAVLGAGLFWVGACIKNKDE